MVIRPPPERMGRITGEYLRDDAERVNIGDNTGDGDDGAFPAAQGVIRISYQPAGQKMGYRVHAIGFIYLLAIMPVKFRGIFNADCIRILFKPFAQAVRRPY